VTRVFALALLVACGGEAPTEAPAQPETTKAATTAPAPAKAAAKGAAVATVGAAAPAFSLPDLDGKTVSLSDFAGKVVVLEWFNPDCPFVVDTHSKDEALGKLAATWQGKEVVWLGINSGAPGKQGHGVDANKAGVERFGIQHPILLDEMGTVGRSYGAKTTPHMYVVDPSGVLAYVGAIDNAPLGKLAGSTYTNYVDVGLGEITGGGSMSTPQTKPYGCSVKYGS
jgi:peroxiredoxin